MAASRRSWGVGRSVSKLNDVGIKAAYDLCRTDEIG